MKTLKQICFVTFLAFSACTSSKISSVEALPAESPNQKTEETKPEQSEKAKEANVVAREEKVTVADTESESMRNMRYYIIIGSFKEYDNAKTYKRQLMDEGFYPGILVNDSGLYRVCIDSYNEESPSRIRINEIRTKFEKYSDVWLLKQQE